MSQYVFPPSGGLKIVYQSRTFGVFCQDVGIGSMLILAENVGGSWNGCWESPATIQLAADITAAGGAVNWIKQFLTSINAEFQALFGTAPPASTPEQQINTALAASFQIISGPTNPLMLLK